MALALNPQAFTGGNVFLHGIGLLGILKGFEQPKIEHEVIEQSGAIGKFEQVLPTLKALSSKLTISGVNPTIFNAMNLSLPLMLYVKQNLSSMENFIRKESQIIATLQGSAKILELPNFEMNKEAELTLEIAVYMFSYQINKVPVIVYDVINNVFAVNGVDQFLEIRKNIS
ncbi:phage major tail tube protein [Helicobacter sp. 12S02232-10]|uniref:phage major tail tube protein n=1 Tax=Helicobacter sp. 12S02232-10 TaxID=1476197 RepID=UPI0015DFE548|nr:phage major tail tube protein [Helicobacter sp. 12S02232-10]